jgi:predicted neuraminidase
VAISDDDGKTWHSSLPIVGRGNVQPALALRKDGHIIAFMRDNGNAPPRVQVSESLDNGETWSAAVKTEIPNEASVEIQVLKDGRWAFIGNDEDDGRYRISLYISNDEGKTWSTKYLLENEAKGKGSFSYPSLNQSTDGNIHITIFLSARECR